VKFSLCHTSDIEDPGSHGFELNFHGAPLDVFVVHSNASFRAYVNSCPHTGVNLEWQENQFLDLDRAFIHCSTHDALFEIDNGLCIAGPCINQSLQALDLLIENDILVLDLPDDFFNQHARSA
jgi:nitrite reductase/ring-hydroxylating ferredoxin subunit